MLFYQRTLHHEKEIIKAGYNLIVLWEHDQQHWTNDIPEIKSHTYPHALVYDFESYFDKTASKKPTPDLTFECNHIPVSVSVGSTLTKDVFHLKNNDPKKLIHDFIESIQGLAENIREQVKAQFLPEDFETGI